MGPRFSLIVLLLLAAASLGGANVSAQSQTHRAAIVARFADGQNLYRCIEFQEASITGEELLRRTGWNVVIDAATDQGSAVCRINDIGCGVEDCFCQCRGGSQCEYWSYWHWVKDDGDWEYSEFGAASYTVSDGALEGWSWGPGNWVTGTEPPAVTFDQICNSTTPSPTPPANTPEPESQAPPDGDFDVEESLLTPGACTILTWVIFDAEQVTLDGLPVAAQDRMEVCPIETQRHVLVATNGAGEFTRELIIEVRDDSALAVPTQAPVQDAPPPAQSTVPPANPGLVAPPTAAPLQGEAAPTPMSLITQTPAPVLEVTATPVVLPAVTETPQAFVLALTALPTPVLIAQVQPGGSEGERATPTPILVALAGGAATEGGTSGAPAARVTLDPALLPGYGAFLLMASGLLGAAAWIWQRSRIR